MSTYEISKSSLLSLKAEILRKQEELSKAKADNDVKLRNLKKNSPLDLKNKGVEQRQTQDTIEEENLLKKSRETLEAKSKLYERLSNNKSKLTPSEAEFNKRYLVRFDKKSRVPDLPPEDSEDDHDRDEDDTIDDDYYSPPKNRDEEWVEYVDCLGRTRTCLRKDLEYLKRKDKDLESIVDAKNRNRKKSRSRSPEPPPRPKSITPEPEISEENELLSSDMRREILRQQWEKEEDELKNKTNIHYQDILFNEARSHGVGYYGFSKDEEERAKQQEALNKLRKETKQQQKKSQDLKAMREKQLAARVRAAMNRKRERMGLPPLEDEPEPTPQPAAPPQVPQRVDEQENKLEEKRKKHIRPWDIGKEGVKSHYEHTQEEWVDKKRKERPTEFAPPSTYQRENKYRKDVDDTKKVKKDQPQRQNFRSIPIINELSDDDDHLLSDYQKLTELTSTSRSKGIEIAPPPTYDYYGPSDSKRLRPHKKPSDVSDSIEAGLKYLREQMEKKQSSSKRSDIFLS